MGSFILGLSTGTACLAYCAPSILPYFLHKDEGARKNYVYLIQFFVGRLIGYMIFGVLAWYIGKLVVLTDAYKPFLMGVAYMLISVVFIYEYFKGKRKCIVKRLSKLKVPVSFSAVIIGFASGVNLCPPFALIFADAANTASLFSGLLAFFLFFCGTSLYFLPLPLIGLIKQKEEIKTISKFLIVLVAVFYFLKGFMMILF